MEKTTNTNSFTSRTSSTVRHRCGATVKLVTSQKLPSDFPTPGFFGVKKNDRPKFESESIFTYTTKSEMVGNSVKREKVTDTEESSECDYEQVVLSKNSQQHRP